MDLIVYTNGRQEVIIPAGGSVAVATQGKAELYQRFTYPNHPGELVKMANNIVSNTEIVYGPFVNGATLIIESLVGPVYYNVGTAPLTQAFHDQKLQPTPGVLNATGALTSAMILAGIVTSTTAAAVAGTVPTGAVLDLAATFAIGDAVDWTVIATGANAFTVTAATGHTLVGTAVVATLTSGRFRTVKTAAATFVTYRLS